jgi:hypothetical protein
MHERPVRKLTVPSLCNLFQVKSIKGLRKGERSQTEDRRRREREKRAKSKQFVNEWPSPHFPFPSFFSSRPLMMSGGDEPKVASSEGSAGLSARLLRWLEKEEKEKSGSPRVVLVALGGTAVAAFGLAFARSLRKHRPPPVAQMLVEAEPLKVGPVTLREGRRESEEGKEIRADSVVEDWRRWRERKRERKGGRENTCVCV